MAKRQIITKLPPWLDAKGDILELSCGEVGVGVGVGGSTFQELHSLTNMKRDNQIHGGSFVCLYGAPLLRDVAASERTREDKLRYLRRLLRQPEQIAHLHKWSLRSASAAPSRPTPPTPPPPTTSGCLKGSRECVCLLLSFFEDS